MKELDIGMIQDLNRIFGYVFIINDGEIKKMIDKNQEATNEYIEMLV